MSGGSIPISCNILSTLIYVLYPMTHVRKVIAVERKYILFIIENHYCIGVLCCYHDYSTGEPTRRVDKLVQFLHQHPIYTLLN